MLCKEITKLKDPVWQKKKNEKKKENILAQSIIH